MAKKEFSKKTINVRKTKTASGGTGIEDVIKGSVNEFSNTLTMDFAAFFTGNANNGKDMQTSKSKALSNKKSLLGDKDSIYSFLQNIKDSLSNKQIKEIVPKSLLLMSANSSLIKDALYLNDEPLINIINRLLTNSGGNADIKLNEKQLQSLKDIIEDKHLTEIMQRIIAAENRANEAIKMGENYYKSFIDTAAKNESNVQNILSSFETRYSELINTNKEELQKLIDLFATDKQNLVDINNQIREDNKEKVTKAKLELMLSGLDPLTIDSLIKFSTINLDQLDKNSEGLIKFFSSLKFLDNMNIKNVSDKLNSIDFILTAIFSQIRIIRDINDFILKKNINIDNFVNVIGSFKTIYDSLSYISTLSKDIDTEKTVAALDSLKKVMNKLIKFIPKFVIINKLFGGRGINLTKTKSTLDSFKSLFESLNSIEVDVNKYNDILKSLFIMGPMVENIIPIGLISDYIKKMNIMQNIQDVNESIFCIFDDINKKSLEFDINTTDQNIQQIQSNITLINSVLTILSALKTDTINTNELQNVSNLFVNDVYDLFTNINEIDNINVDKSKKMLESLSSIKTIIATLDSLKFDETKLQETLKHLSAVFNTTEETKNEKTVKSLTSIFTSINNLKELNQNKVNKAVQGLGGIKNIIDILIYVSDQKYSKVEKGFDKFLKTIEKIYKKINDRFDQIIALGNKADEVNKANQKISAALKNTNDTIVKTSANEAQIKKSTLALEGITEFMVSATFVMAIGALFVEIGGGKFVKDALEFGIVLSIFEGLVLLPAIAFVTQEKQATKGVEGLHKLLITSTIILGIGALFMYISNGEFVKNALKFGLVLSVFELLIVSPFMMFAAVKSDVLSNVKDLNTVVLTSTIIMAIGALFMYIGNGAFVKAALAFGVVLSAFEMLIITPFILFSAISDEVFKNVKAFTSLVIVSTVILSIGAFFVHLNKGEFVKSALAFAVILGVFEALVILPFILFNKVEKDVYDGINAFTGCVMVATLALLIGAYVMKSKEITIGALMFTGLLMAFETGIILPFLIFNLVEDKVFDGLKSFSLVVLVSTAALIMGAYFVSAQNGKFVKDAFIFIGILATFMAGITLPFLLFKQRANQFIKGAQEFGMFVAICSFSLMIGAYALELIGKGSTWEGTKTIVAYAVILGLFVFSMVTIAKGIQQIKKKDIEAALQFSLFVLICSSSLILGATLFAMGPEYIIGGIIYAVVLGFFVLAMGAVMVYINKSFKAAGGDAKVIAQAITLGGFILLCSVSLAISAFVFDTYKENAIWGAIMLTVFIGVIGLVFAGLTAMSVFILPGAVIATLMGVSLLTISTSLLIVNSLMGDGKDEILKKNIGALNTVIGMLANTYDDKLSGKKMFWITMGSVAATALGASLILLGGSLALINKLMGEGRAQELLTNITLLDNIIDEHLKTTYEKLGESAGWIALGSVAGIALSGSIVLLTGALRLINFFIDPIKDELINNIKVIDNSLNSYKGVIKTLTDMGDDILMGLFIIAPLGLLTYGLSKSIVSMSNAVKSMAGVGDISNQSAIISNNINSFIGIIDNIELGAGTFGIGLIEKLAKIAALSAMIIPMNLAIRGIASSVQSIASLRIPEEWDENGKPTKFRQISNKDFDLVTININRLLRTTADAFAYAWNHGLKTIAQDKNGGFWKTLHFANSASTILANMTDSVIKIGQALVPDPTSWDPEKGKFIKYQKIDFLKTSIDAGIVVYSILTMISDAFVSAYNGTADRPGLKTLFYKDSPFTKAVDAITKMTQTLSGITDSVIKIASAQIPNKWDKDGKVISYEKINVEEAIKNFRKVLIGNGKTPGIINSMLGAFKMAAARILNNEILSDDEKMKLITGRITSMIDIIGKAAGFIVQISSLTIPTEFDKDGKGTNFVKLSITDIDNAKTNITTILKAILSTFDPNDPNNEIASYLGSEIINTQYISKNLDNVGIIIKSLTTQISNINTLQDELNKTFNKKKGDVIDVSNVVAPFDDIMNKLFNHLNSLKRIYTEDFSGVDFNNNNVFKKISEDVQNYMNNVVDPFDPVRLLKASTLVISIDNIYKTLAKQKNTSGNVNANTNALKTYIKAINTVDTSKLKPLTTLVIELNKLANKLGSLDKVANSLSNELAVVLKELVDSLNEAKGTINSAHQLQGDRHNKIEEAITKIRTLMDSPLNITVKTESSMPEQQFESPGDDSTKSDNKYSVSSDGSGAGGAGTPNNASNHGSVTRHQDQQPLSPYIAQSTQPNISSDWPK